MTRICQARQGLDCRAHLAEQQGGGRQARHGVNGQQQQVCSIHVNEGIEAHQATQAQVAGGPLRPLPHTQLHIRRHQLWGGRR